MPSAFAVRHGASHGALFGDFAHPASSGVCLLSRSLGLVSDSPTRRATCDMHYARERLIHGLLHQGAPLTGPLLVLLLGQNLVERRGQLVYKDAIHGLA